MALLDKILPASSNAETLLNEKAQALNDFQETVNASELKLNELHEQDADVKLIQRAEADLNKATVNRDRAMKALEVAQRKAEAYKKVEHEKASKQNIKTRDEALKRRIAAAKKLDDSIELLKEFITEFNETAEILDACRSKKVVSWESLYMYGKSELIALLSQALYLADVPNAHLLFTYKRKLNKDKMKSIVDQVKYVNDTITIEYTPRANPNIKEPKPVYEDVPVTETPPTDTRPVVQVQPSESKAVNYSKKNPDQESSVKAADIIETVRA